MGYLSAHAIVVLFAAARPDEAKVVDRWITRFPELKLAMREHEKGTADVQRLRQKTVGGLLQ